MQLQSNIKNLTSKGIKIGCHEHLDMNLKRLANKKGMISGIYKVLEIFLIVTLTCSLYRYDVKETC